MLINFNVEKLNELLYDFHRLTGVSLSVWNADLDQLGFQPKEMCEYCRLIKESPLGKRRCYLSDKKICIKCGKTGKPETHYCHAGLLDTAIPIKFKNEILGYIIFGQIASEEQKNAPQLLPKLSKDLKINLKKLSDAYNNIRTFDNEKISSAGNILKAVTRYLWLSEYIEIGYNTKASQIDDYIQKNINTDLSVQTLCEKLNLSKNKLYEISRESFGMTIGDYIASIRLAEAKRLLTTTDYPINWIGGMVGITDYNYFSKFFKAKVGTTPLKYRKNFPFNLHES